MGLEATPAPKGSGKEKGLVQVLKVVRGATTTAQRILVPEIGMYWIGWRGAWCGYSCSCWERGEIKLEMGEMGEM